MRHPHKWHEMLPEEFYREFERTPVAYFPCGAVGEHGLHNSLAVDPWTAYELCVRAADRSGGGADRLRLHAPRQPGRCRPRYPDHIAGNGGLDQVGAVCRVGPVPGRMSADRLIGDGTAL